MVNPVKSFLTHGPFSSLIEKTSRYPEIIWQLGPRFGGHCRCREVAIVERWPLAEVRPYHLDYAQANQPNL